MSDLDLVGLREIAGKATPGRWAFSPDDGSALDADVVFTLDDAGEEASTVTSWRDANDATHIAAFDPETVLALLDRIEELEAAEARLDKIRARHLRAGTKAQSVCVHCDTAWPCETIKILDGEADDH